MKRTGKFYRKNEAEVMESLGLKPTKNSGSGWVEKEDGQNDFVICQLKSTDAESIRVKQKDIRTLEYNAGVSHKLPVFAIQFLNTGEVWLMAKPEDFCEVSKFITSGVCNTTKENDSLELDDTEDSRVVIRKVIKSSEDSREAFNEERQRKFAKENKAW